MRWRGAKHAVAIEAAVETDKTKLKELRAELADEVEVGEVGEVGSEFTVVKGESRVGYILDAEGKPVQITFVVVTHEPDVADQTERTIFLKDGRVTTSEEVHLHQVAMS